MSRAAAIAVLALVPGCIAVEVYPCERDEECDLDGREGTCEADRVCSYPDDDCLSGRRYDDRAGGDCVAMRLDCEDYCRRYGELCSGETSQYIDSGHCLAHCAQWPVGTLDDTAGDSLGCRINQLGRVGEFHPAFACTRAGPSGLDACVAPERPPCALYCEHWAAKCEAALGLLPPADCPQVCSTWYPGELSEVEEHSVGCRIVRLIVIEMTESESDRLNLCRVASPDGFGVCVLHDEE